MARWVLFSLVVSLWVCAESTLKAAAEGPAQLATSLATTGSVTIKGTPVTLVGHRVDVGQKAPTFSAMDGTFKPVGISQFSGRPILISAVPSLDTPVCSLQTKRFNDALSELPKDVAVVTISMDLPFAQKRFCASEKVDRIHVWSDSARREFGTRYGILIKERGLLARAVFVIGKDGLLAYKEVVGEVSKHPDYEAALKAIRDASARDTAGALSEAAPQKKR